MARTIRTPSGPLVRAVYARLNAAAITQTLRAGVYGDVPPGASLP